MFLALRLSPVLAFPDRGLPPRVPPLHATQCWRPPDAAVHQSFNPFLLAQMLMPDGLSQLQAEWKMEATAHIAALVIQQMYCKVRVTLPLVVVKPC